MLPFYSLKQHHAESNMYKTALHTKKTTFSRIQVHIRPGTGQRKGVLRAGNMVFPCALGKGGVRADKREGDGATPRTVLRIRGIWWRQDQGIRPQTPIKVRPTRSKDGWCDAPRDRNYNRPVILPYGASHEHMWRDDSLYALVVELNWNDFPRKRGKGSAIFMHIARENYHPTEGCIALKINHLRRLLLKLSPLTHIIVG